MGKLALRAGKFTALAVGLIGLVLGAGCIARDNSSLAAVHGTPHPIAADAPADPAQLFAGLPAPPQDAYVDPAVILARRSSFMQRIPLLGDEVYALAGCATADIQNHLLWLDPGVKTVAWGIYEFADLTYGDLPLEITVHLQAPRPAELYIAYSDYERGVWRWQVVTAPLADSNISVPGNLKTISNGGKFYVAVATYDLALAQVARVQLELDAIAPAPQGFTASDGTSGSTIEIAWTALETSYPGLVYDKVCLERAYIAAGPWSKIAELPPGTSTYADVHTGAANNIPYNEPVYYRTYTVVSLLDGHPTSADSGLRLLADVQNVQAADGTDPLAICITWDAVAGAGLYQIEYRCISGDDPVDWTALTQVLAPAVQFSHTGAEPVGKVAVEGETYAYRIKAEYLADFSLNWSADETGFRNAAPVADVAVDPASGNPPLSVDLDASGSYDPGGGNITGYEWDFDGDGTFDSPRTSDPTITYVYARQGEFQPVVRVTDDENEQSTGAGALTVGGWVHTWGGSGGDRFHGMAVDSNGNIYAAGMTESFGAGQSDVLLVKYDAGGAYIWARTWGLAGQDVVQALAIDAADNVWLTGATDGAGSATNDVLLLKFDPLGQLQLQRIWDGSGDDQAYAILRAGEYMKVCGDTTSNTGSGSDLLYLRFDAAGEVDVQCAWGDTGQEFARGATIDNFNHVFIAGTTDSTGQGLQDVLIAALNSNNTLWWAKTWGGPQTDEGLSISTNNTDLLIGGSTNSSGAGGEDALLLWLTTGGGVRFRYCWGGADDDAATAATFNPGGHVYVTGQVQQPGAGATDLLLLRFNALGVFSWAKSCSSAGGDQAGSSLLCLSDSTLLVGGMALDTGGAWTVSGASAGLATGSIAPLTISAHYFGEPSVDVNGTVGTPAGSLDTGGGGGDSLVLTYNSQAQD